MCSTQDSLQGSNGPLQSLLTHFPTHRLRTETSLIPRAVAILCSLVNYSWSAYLYSTCAVVTMETFGQNIRKRSFSFFVVSATE